MDGSADYLRGLAEWFQRRAHRMSPQITHAGETESAVAARLETIAEEIDADTNVGEVEDNG